MEEQENSVCKSRLVQFLLLTIHLRWWVGAGATDFLSKTVQSFFHVLYRALCKKEMGCTEMLRASFTRNKSNNTFALSLINAVGSAYNKRILATFWPFRSSQGFSEENSKWEERWEQKRREEKRSEEATSKGQLNS